MNVHMKVLVRQRLIESGRDALSVEKRLYICKRRRKVRPAKEIYEALEKTVEHISAASNSIYKVLENVETIRNLSEIKSDVTTEEKENALDTGIATFAALTIEVTEDIESLLDRAKEQAEEGLEESEAVGEGHAPTEKELRDIYREKHTNIKILPAEETEDKQGILNRLLGALKHTRAGKDVRALQDNKDGSMWILFENGAIKPVNIDCDSGIAMIIDVCRALM